MRVGSGELQAHREWQSAGGGGLRGGAGKAYDAAVCAGRSARGFKRCGGSAGDVSHQQGRVYAGSLENSAGGRIEGGAFGRERAEVPAGGEFGDYGLSDGAAER